MNANQSPPDSLRLLIRLLAQTDALFIPLRDPSDPCWSHVWERRGTFHKSGIAWRAGGTETARKSAERQLQELAKAKLVRIFRAGGRAVSVKLTPRGDAVGRDLAHLRPIDMAVELVQEMHSLRDDPESSADTGDSCHDNDHPWLPETAFTYPDRGVGWGDGNTLALIDVNHRMALPMVLGWVESLCSTTRHVRYRLLPAGLAVAEGKATPHSLPEDLPGRQEWAETQYDDDRDAARKDLWSLSEYSNDIGRIPLRASFMTKGAAKELAAKGNR